MSRKRFNTEAVLLCTLAFSITPAFSDEAAAPGPGLEQRQKLLERIQQARAQGIGIGGYLQAFKAVEDQVKAGDNEDKIKSRVQSIHKAVDDQIERAKVLKTQKPIPPQGSQITGSGPIADSAPAGNKANPAPAAESGGGGGDILSKLKNKFGDKLDNIPDSVKERLLNNPNTPVKIFDKPQAVGGDGGGSRAPGGGGGGRSPGND